MEGGQTVRPILLKLRRPGALGNASHHRYAVGRKVQVGDPALLLRRVGRLEPRNSRRTGRPVLYPTNSVRRACDEQVLAAVEAIESELGPIDIWVNNAMVSVFAPFLEMSVKDFARVNDVTYLSYVNCTHAVMRRMVARDRGCIVQVGSALAYRGIPLQSAYCGAKHAIQGFTESVRCELLHDKSMVRITMVQLPALNTPQFHWVKTNFDKHPQPVPPIFQPEVAA
ncbi:MAG: SDR family NAD(P)-dependent oxidoreductase, partial [Actinobacteria bacterium]|nr:SDR family NAD(P)-dependent oxidoreductase [Actinomycetota bacterium]